MPDIYKSSTRPVQSALQKGLVAGGGAAELAVARQLEQNKNALSGMAVFGGTSITVDTQMMILL